MYYVQQYVFSLFPNLIHIRSLLSTSLSRLVVVLYRAFNFCTNCLINQVSTSNENLRYPHKTNPSTININWVELNFKYPKLKCRITLHRRYKIKCMPKVHLWSKNIHFLYFYNKRATDTRQLCSTERLTTVVSRCIASTDQIDDVDTQHFTASFKWNHKSSSRSWSLPARSIREMWN